MAKFIFICRGCGKKFKQKANTLQSARENLAIRIGGEKLGEDQGIICNKCLYLTKIENLDCDYGTIVEDW